MRLRSKPLQNVIVDPDRDARFAGRLLDDRQVLPDICVYPVSSKPLLERASEELGSHSSTGLRIIQPWKVPFPDLLQAGTRSQGLSSPRHL